MTTDPARGCARWIVGFYVAVAGIATYLVLRLW